MLPLFCLITRFGEIFSTCYSVQHRNRWRLFLLMVPWGLSTKYEQSAEWDATTVPSVLESVIHTLWPEGKVTKLSGAMACVCNLLPASLVLPFLLNWCNQGGSESEASDAVVLVCVAFYPLGAKQGCSHLAAVLFCMPALPNRGHLLCWEDVLPSEHDAQLLHCFEKISGCWWCDWSHSPLRSMQTSGWKIVVRYLRKELWNSMPWKHRLQVYYYILRSCRS